MECDNAFVSLSVKLDNITKDLMQKNIECFTFKREAQEAQKENKVGFKTENSNVDFCLGT